MKNWRLSKTAIRYLLFPVMVVITGISISLALPTDYVIENYVLGNGGGRISNSEYLVVGTVGQFAIGTVEDSRHWLFSGVGHDFPGIQWTDVLAEADQVSSLPRQYRLEQNYPNPFNPATTIKFALPHATHVELKVYNILGEPVATLVDGELSAGEYDVLFDADGLPSGMYLYRIQADTYVQTRKLVLMK